MEESDSEKKMEKENLGPRVDPPIGEPEGSLGWVKGIMPNLEMGVGVGSEGLLTEERIMNENTPPAIICFCLPVRLMRIMLLATG